MSEKEKGIRKRSEKAPEGKPPKDKSDDSPGPMGTGDPEAGDSGPMGTEDAKQNKDAASHDTSEELND